MRMPTNNEDGKAQPEMPEVQGEGDCPGLQQLLRERMEPEHKPPMPTMQRNGISDPKGKS